MGSKYFFENERVLDDKLKELLLLDGLPGALREHILLAQKELDQSGAISYPTQARIDYYYNHYYNTIVELVEKYQKEHPQV